MKRILKSGFIIGIFSCLLIASQIVYASNGNYVWPVPDSKSNSDNYNKNTHPATDISANLGSNIIATKSGTVMLAYTGCNNSNARSTGVSCSWNTCSPSNGAFFTMNNMNFCNFAVGNGVIIKHDDGTWAEYSHMNKINVSNNSYVNQGDVIGTVGSTGNSFSPHLHFGLYSSGIVNYWQDYKKFSFDPLSVVNKNNEISTPSPVTNLKAEKEAYSTRENIKFTWDKAYGASETWIYLWRDGEQVFMQNVGIETTYTFSPLSEGNYTLCIRPGNTNGLFNEDSEPFSFVVTDKKPLPVTNLKAEKEAYSTRENIKFTWDKAYGASETWIYLWRDGEQIFMQNVGTETTYTFSPLSEGNYTLCIRPGNVNGFNDESKPFDFVIY